MTKGKKYEKLCKIKRTTKSKSLRNYLPFSPCLDNISLHLLRKLEKLHNLCT